MAREKKSKESKKPFNHVLEVQNSVIDIRDLFKKIDARVKEKQEAKNG